MTIYRKALILILCLSPALLQAEVFRFRYVEGAKFHAVAQIDETVIVRYGYQQTVQQSQMLYKIAYTVTDTEDGAGFLNGSFQIATKSSGQAGVYEKSEEHPTAYWRNADGTMRFPQFYSFPVVRNVPRFPERDIKPGETWVGQGEEVHDFRDTPTGIGILRFPINVAYQYRGIERYKGEELHAIDATYNVYHRFPSSSSLAPEQISGFSAQKLYWDNELGYLKGYSEEFELVMHFNDGSVQIFRGTGAAEVIQAEKMEKERVAEDIRKTLDDEGVADSNVRIGEEGVTIALSNIQFQPDSSRFMPGEERKIETVARILKNYPGRDILVSGHTALAGSAEGRQRLSVERARVVAQELIRLGARREAEIVIRGAGAREPIADNSSEAGRRLNRRVEITILEN